ncbi:MULTISPECIES: DUF2306 domain-containing protein [unclassified Streptomyces]|uniref:DUF2306 domain-containing protein n=1 Tax=unclassified Streptomyces TaxID=2593676 RepID=UPI00036F546B|nr:MULTISPECIES: DUF2306 domain-containing protein [unclassified Streptomyces]
MTITTTEPGRSPDGAAEPRREAGGAEAPPRWWRRPWVGPLALVVGVFLVMGIPRYLTFDPADSKIPPNPQYPWHYPVLVVHILAGTVAIVTCCLQVWPALRRRHPRVHRLSGRLYVAAVLSGGPAALAVAYASPSGLSMQMSTMTTSVLWIGTAAAGLRMARQGRIAEHRRWMVRSFALTMSIVLSRVLGVVYDHTILPPPVTQNVAELIAWGQQRAGLASWPGWILPLLFAEWWLVERGAGARHRARAARRKAVAPRT